MALFEGEDIISVDVVSVNMVDEIPNLIKDAAIVAIMQNQSIANHVILASIAGLHSAVTKYLRAGNASYIFGLPEGDISAGVIDKPALLNAINEDMLITTAAYGVEEPIVSNFVDMFFVYHQLEKLYGWTLKTNQATNPSNGKKYNLSAYSYLVSGDKNYVYVTLTEDSGFPGPDWNLYLEYLIGYPYYNVVYYVNADPADKRYYTYSGWYVKQHPELEFGKQGYGENYLPIVPIRINRRDVDDSSPENDRYNEDLHLSCERQLKYTSIELSDLTSGLNENEDIDDIQAAFFMYAVPIYSEEPASKQYLFKYFEDLYPKSGVNAAQFSQWVAGIQGGGPVSDPPINQHRVQEIDGYFNMAIQYNYMTTTDVDDVDYPEEYQSEWTDGTSPDSLTISYDDGFGGTRYGHVIVENGTFTVRGPRYDEDGTTVLGSTEYTVYGLVIKTTIRAFNESTLTVTRLSDPDDPWVPTDPTTDPKTGFIIPVNHNLLKSIYGVNDDEVLYDAMQLVIYAGVKESLKWYETDTFLTFVKFIMSYISLVMAAFGMSAEGITLMQIILKALGTILVGLASNYLLENVDGTLGIILAAVVAIAGSYVVNNGGFEGILDNLIIPTIKDLMGIVYTVADLINKDIQLEIQEVADEYSDWLEEAHGIGVDLYEAVESYFSNPVSTVDFAGVTAGISTMQRNESPSDFINRTIHLQNPGVLSLDMIHTYVDRAMTLPRPVEF